MNQTSIQNKLLFTSQVFDNKRLLTKEDMGSHFYIYTWYKKRKHLINPDCKGVFVTTLFVFFLLQNSNPHMGGRCNLEHHLPTWNSLLSRIIYQETKIEGKKKSTQFRIKSACQHMVVGKLIFFFSLYVEKRDSLRLAKL